MILGIFIGIGISSLVWAVTFGLVAAASHRDEWEAHQDLTFEELYPSTFEVEPWVNGDAA